MITRRRHCLAVLAASPLLFVFDAGSAAAQSLDQLRASGAVGERYDGFLEALDSSAETTVAKINAERRKIYAQRAKEEGVSLDQIGRVYAKQIFKKAPAGTKFLDESGNWVTK